MSGGQRAFAQKIQKKGSAAEVRKQVSSAYLGDIPKSVSGLNLAAAQGGRFENVPLCDVVDPPDFEDYVFTHQNAVDRDPLRHLLEFPPDDVTVEMLRRHCRTIAPIVPEHSAESDPHVRDCIKCYTSDYTVVNRRYEDAAKQHWHRENTAEGARHEYEVDVDMDEENADTDREPVVVKPSSITLHETTPRGSWASSIFDLKNSQADPLLPNLFDRIPTEDMDAINAGQRQRQRSDAIFTLYPAQMLEEIVERRQPGAVPAEHFGHRILVKCLQLKLELEIEPIFASMALYDAREKKKISENFYFDLTPEPVKKMLGSHIPYQDISTLSRSCIFSITYPSADVYLVIKLEKVLQQGDIGEVAEPYMKDERNREKAKGNAAYYCERLGKYRMPFAWTAIYLMNIVTGANSLEREVGEHHARMDSPDRRSSLVGQYESFRKRSRDEGGPGGFLRHGSLERQRSGSEKRQSAYLEPEVVGGLDTFRPITLTVSSFFKQEADKLSDDDIYKFLQDLKRPTSVLKKLKCIPGILKLDVSPCPEEPKYCLTPELYRIDPYPDDKGRPTKETLEFPARDVYEPNTTYRNLMYVYPKYLNFANRQGSARNIAVKVQFMSGEEETHALPVIFGKSSCPELVREVYSSVTYHSKSPYFYEEVKMKLPARLTDSHHLLFTMYHVSCQRKADLGPVETPIGYTWLPLLRDGRLVTGDFQLPVSLEKPPPSYSMLHPDVQLPGMRWVDNHKGIFNVSLDAVTSIYTLDEHLDRYLNLVHAAEEHRIPPRIGEGNFEAELKKSISDIGLARSGPLVRFLPLTLDKLLSLLVRPPTINGQSVNIGQASFEAIAQVVKRVGMIVEAKNDQHGRNSLLTTYIEYTCALPHPEPTQPGFGNLWASFDDVSPAAPYSECLQRNRSESVLCYSSAAGQSDRKDASYSAHHPPHAACATPTATVPRHAV